MAKKSPMVKITAMVPRELWARLRAKAVLEDTTVSALLTEAVAMLLTHGSQFK